MGDFRAHPTGIEGLVAVSARSAHSFPKHTHDEFGIGLVTAGSQLSASGRGQVEAGTGDVITVNPGEVHDGMPVCGRTRQWSMFYLSTDLLASLLPAFTSQGLSATEFQSPVLRGGLASRSFKSLWTVLTNPDFGQGVSHEEALLTLLAPVLRPSEMTALPTNGKGILKVKARIDDDPDCAPSLAELSEIAGLSRFQTLRAFARLAGLTPHAYILQQRVLRAKRLIAGGRALADAAAECGFADQSHMTREFTRRYGLSPARFQKAVLGCNPVQDGARRSH